ncbi:transcriptional regulator, partial [Salmonella enterica]|nr:transcriptional regulator [Salmonella enterica]
MKVRNKVKQLREERGIGQNELALAL